jgi:hypothetical protein
MIIKSDPMGLPRNPFHVFLFIIALFNGLSLMFAEPTSTAIENAFDDQWRIAYGALLSVGAGLVLAGMYWQGDRRSGLFLKRGGYLGLCFATFIYSMAVIFVLHSTGGVLAASVTLGFSGVCGWQVHVINRRVKEELAGTIFVPEWEGRL